MEGLIIKIQLRDIDFEVSRTVKVPGDTSFQDLHFIIQNAFGFFEVGNYGFMFFDGFNVLSPIKDYFKKYETLIYKNGLQTRGYWILEIKLIDFVEFNKDFPELISFEGDYNFYGIFKGGPDSYKKIVNSLESNLLSRNEIPLGYTLIKINFEYLHAVIHTVRIKRSSKSLTINENEGYNIKLRIKDYPHIWRDLIIPQNLTFYGLHLIIQSIFSFDNRFIGYFKIGFYTKVVDVYQKELGNTHFIRNTDYFHSNTPICPFFNKFKKLDYYYNSYKISVEIKGVKPLSQEYPLLIRYKGEYNPSEDLNYYDFHKAINNPLFYKNSLNKFNLEKIQEDLKEEFL